MTPTKRLMRERSSPGIRKSINNENFNQQMKFDDIYKSVERLGGIGSSRSLFRERDLSQASNRGRNQSPASQIGEKGKVRAIIKLDEIVKKPFDPITFKNFNKSPLVHSKQKSVFERKIDRVRGKELDGLKPLKRKV